MIFDEMDTGLMKNSIPQSQVIWVIWAHHCANLYMLRKKNEFVIHSNINELKSIIQKEYFIFIYFMCLLLIGDFWSVMLQTDFT